jgi:hypothetical protein
LKRRKIFRILRRLCGPTEIERPASTKQTHGKRPTTISNAADNSQPDGVGAVLRLWIASAEGSLLLTG